jgi:hypothetical protein
MMASALSPLLQHPALWRGDALAPVAVPGLASGYPALDAELPGGGWPVGALTELLLDREGIGELRLLMPALAGLTRAGRWVAWVAPPHLPYAPALAAAGVVLSRLLVVGRSHPREAWWAAEQALRAGVMGAVVCWPGEIDGRALRRLQLAAEAGGSAGFLFRPLQAAEAPSPAALRLALAPKGGGLVLRILKRRGAAATLPLHLRFSAPLSRLGEGGEEGAGSAFTPTLPPGGGEGRQAA